MLRYNLPRFHSAPPEELVRGSLQQDKLAAATPIGTPAKLPVQFRSLRDYSLDKPPSYNTSNRRYRPRSL